MWCLIADSRQKGSLLVELIFALGLLLGVLGVVQHSQLQLMRHWRETKAEDEARGKRMYDSERLHRELHSAWGFTFVEFVVSVAILSIIAAIAFSSLRQMFGLTIQYQAKEEVQHNANAVLNRVSRGIDSSTSFFGARGFKLHGVGTLLDAHDKPLKSFASPSTRPNLESNAISFLELEPMLLLRTISTDTARATGELELCLGLEEIPPAYDAEIRSKHWLGVCLDGVIELDGTIKQLGGTHLACPSGKRYSAKLQLAATQVFTQIPPDVDPDDALRRVLALTPIADAYTLYVSEQKIFRRLSHNNSENQPIANNVSALRIATALNAGGLQKLTVEVDSHDNLERTSIRKSLTRSLWVAERFSLLDVIL